MKKILHLITGMDAGGAQMALVRLLRRIDGNRFDSLVVSMKDGGAYSERIKGTGVRIRTMGMKGPLDILKGAWKLRRILKEERPHLISAWMYHANAAAVLGRYLGWRGPIVWNIRHSLHAIKSERLNTAVVILFGRMMSARANSIIYNSRTSSRQHERFGYCCTNSDYIPNGFDCSEYKPDEGSRSKLIHELSLDADSLIIGHAGRYHRMKDHKTMLIAASFLAKLYGKAHFVFVGSGVNGNNLELANLINEYALNGRVSLLGERKDLSGIYPALDLFVSSSYSESFSNVVAEAMSCGIPCVVTDVGDLASIVNDTGYVVSTGDPYALANAIKKMIVMGSEKRAKLGSMARARIKEHYSLDRILNKYEAIYQKLISEPDKSLNKYNKVVERSGVL